MSKLFKGFNSIIKDVSETDRSLVALVSTNTRDRMDEVLDPEGADLENFKKNPVVLFAHDMRQPPIGRAIWIKQAAEGIIAKVQFASTQLGEDIFQLYKNKFMRAFSVGFIGKEWVDGDGEHAPSRTFKKWELLEFSAVPVPANPDALALAMKSVKSDIMKKELEIEKMGTDVEEAIKNSIIRNSKPAPDGNKTPANNEQDGSLEQLMLAEEEKALLVKQHAQEIENLSKEIADLKYTLYVLSAKLQHQPGTLSEITDEGIAKLIEQSVDGVIRDVTGKVS